MSTEVRIVKLEPMRVVSFHGFGHQPEMAAWNKLEAWARSRGYWGKLEAYPIYGFNNPDPTPASPNYGYELWMRIHPDDSVEEGIKTLDFPGGMYGVLRCPVPKEDYDVIGRKWRDLVSWREASRFAFGQHQWLENSVHNTDPDIAFVLDLYMPIEE